MHPRRTNSPESETLRETQRDPLSQERSGDQIREALGSPRDARGNKIREPKEKGVWGRGALREVDRGVLHLP